jgi:hypothetical protein
MITLIAGTIAIVLGLHRGLAEGIRRIPTVFGGPPPVLRTLPDGRLPGQIWFAVVGAALIAVGVAQFAISAIGR